MFPAALRYLGLNPDSKNEADLNKAGELLRKIRPHIQKFHSSEYINALANGDICLAVGYSGDILQAKKRAEEAKNNVQIAYAIPKEGALMWFDSFVIPKDAPAIVDAALKFIDFVNRPAMAAEELGLHPVCQRQPRLEAAALTWRCATTPASTPRMR